MAPLNTSGNVTNGILSIAPPSNSGDAQRQSAAKPPAPRLKVIVRRLPPGLSQKEFIDILGPEWQIGQGKVDWFVFKSGKISKDPSKLSRPSRVYIHLTSHAYLLHLSDVIRQSVFEDAQNTMSNKCLIGPPVVEYAPYGCTPSLRSQSDARTGTIDHDPEFMAFLEGLANPTKEAPTEIPTSAGPKSEKVTTTPLVQYLREKKATKTKEVAAKSTKKQEIHSMRCKNEKESISAPDDSKNSRDGKPNKVVSKAAKEAVKILNRDTSTKAAPLPAPAPTLKSTSPKPASPPSPETVAPKPDVSRDTTGRQRETAMVAHIRMLQRDLGLRSAQAYRQARRHTSETSKIEKAITDEKANPVAKEPSAPNPKNPTPQISQPQVVPTAPRKNSNSPSMRRTRGKVHMAESNFNSFAPTIATTRPMTPVVLLKKSEPVHSVQSSSVTPPPATTPAMPKSASSTWKPPPVPPPTEGATQAFVKHANPSQGVTEPLLKEAMEKFGAVTKVEIDRKKGFAYVDFVETEGLRKAVAANPISVAQGTVQVLQRKGTTLPLQKKVSHHPSNNPARNGRGGRSRPSGRRGGRNL